MNDSKPGATPPPEEDRGRAGLTLWQIVASTLAAAFGVQSSRNRERDFTVGKPTHFIVAGIAFTILFVVAMIFVVRLVVSSAG
jgi:uncharacterized membrane protein YhdT